VPGERAVAESAQAVDIAASFGGVDLQAGVLAGVKWAEIQPAPPGWRGPLEPDQILDVVCLVILGDGDSCVVSLPGWRGFRLR
jgi:hypothetical protein